MDLTNQVVNEVSDVIDTSLGNVAVATETGTSNDFTLDDIYFKDAFTKTGNQLNLEVNHAKVDCITSQNNKFSLDEEGNLTVKSITLEKDNSSNLDKNAVCNLIYPVGSLYMSISSTNPTNLFGGTWERITGYYLYAGNGGNTAGSNTSSGPSTNSTGSTALTLEQMPSHRHGNNNSVPNTFGYAVMTTEANKFLSKSNEGVGSVKEMYDTGLNGGGQGHTHTLNNHTHTVTPLRYEVYMWKRTA